MPFAYSPYGFFCGGPEYPLLHFDGEAWDGWSASYPLGKGKRFYRPKLMRFTTPDNLSPFRAGGVNAYAYCKGDPVNFTDPSGMMRTLKSLAQQALKKQGVISKRSKKILRTIELDEWAPPSRSSPELEAEYHQRRHQGMSADEIASAYPHLKASYKKYSRQTALMSLFGGDGVEYPVLSKHKVIVDRVRPLISEAYIHEHFFQPAGSHIWAPTRGSIINRAARHGLSRQDQTKLLRWLRREGSVYSSGFSSSSSSSDLSDIENI